MHSGARSLLLGRASPTRTRTRPSIVKAALSPRNHGRRACCRRPWPPARAVNRQGRIRPVRRARLHRPQLSAPALLDGDRDRRPASSRTRSADTSIGAACGTKSIGRRAPYPYLAAGGRRMIVSRWGPPSSKVTMTESGCPVGAIWIAWHLSPSSDTQKTRYGRLRGSSRTQRARRSAAAGPALRPRAGR
jgi:hypothetical protein